MFGVMDLSAEFHGCRFSIGLRNANDKSMRLALTAGLRVTVCDNMMFSGDFTPLLHKHTRKLELLDAISIAVDRIQRGFAPLQRQIANWEETHLPDNEVKLIIYEAFMDKRLKVPKHLMGLVHQLYFKPEQEAFEGRTFWSLSNAFTSAFKKLQPIQQFLATAKLGSFLSDVYDRLPEEVIDELYGPTERFRPFLVGNQSEAGSLSENGELAKDDPADDEIREIIEELEKEFSGETDDFLSEFDEVDSEAEFDNESEILSDSVIEETVEEKPKEEIVEAAVESETIATAKSADGRKSKRKAGKKPLKLAA